MGRLVGEEAGKGVLRAIPLPSQLVKNPITIAVGDQNLGQEGPKDDKRRKPLICWRCVFFGRPMAPSPKMAEIGSKSGNFLQNPKFFLKNVPEQVKMVQKYPLRDKKSSESGSGGGGGRIGQESLGEGVLYFPPDLLIFS